jgi:hypothetical protein
LLEALAVNRPAILLATYLHHHLTELTFCKNKVVRRTQRDTTYSKASHDAHRTIFFFNSIRWHRRQ